MVFVAFLGALVEFRIRAFRASVPHFDAEQQLQHIYIHF